MKFHSHNWLKLSLALLCFAITAARADRGVDSDVFMAKLQRLVETEKSPEVSPLVAELESLTEMHIRFMPLEHSTTESLLKKLYFIVRLRNYTAARFALIGIRFALRDMQPGQIRLPEDALSALWKIAQLQRDPAQIDSPLDRAREEARETLRTMGIVDPRLLEEHFREHTPFEAVELAKSFSNYAWENDFVEKIARGPSMAGAIAAGLVDKNRRQRVEDRNLRIQLLSDLVIFAQAEPTPRLPNWVYGPGSDLLLTTILALSDAPDEEVAALAIRILAFSGVKNLGIFQTRSDEFPIFSSYMVKRLNDPDLKKRAKFIIHLTGIRKVRGRPTIVGWLATWDTAITLIIENLSAGPELQPAVNGFLQALVPAAGTRLDLNPANQVTLARVLHSNIELPTKLLVAEFILRGANKEFLQILEDELLNLITSKISIEAKRRIAQAFARRTFSSLEQLTQAAKVVETTHDGVVSEAIAEAFFRTMNDYNIPHQDEALTQALLALAHRGTPLVRTACRWAQSEVNGSLGRKHKNALAIFLDNKNAKTKCGPKVKNAAPQTEDN